MELKDFLDNIEKFKIVEIDSNQNCIKDKFDNGSYSSDDNYISVADENGNTYNIEFKLCVSWDIVRSGDGIDSPYEKLAEDIEVEIDLINIEDYDNDVQIELNDKELISNLENWIIEKLDIT